MKPSFNAIAFDLDQTLIDSGPCIIESFEKVFKDHGVAVIHHPQISDMGPPLAQLVERFTGIEPQHPDNIRIGEWFKQSYDFICFDRSPPYPHIQSTLDHLFQSGLPMGLATQKRMRPTQAILKFLKWQFHDVFAADSGMEKYQALIHMSKTRDSSLQWAYVGDSWSDFMACQKAGWPLFFWASWGHDIHHQSSIRHQYDLWIQSNPDFSPLWIEVASPQDILLYQKN